MTESRSITLLVNGAEKTVVMEPRLLLSDLLRDYLDLTSINLGCEEGVCGSCTVLLDGDPAASCLILAVQAEGRAVTTLEGLGDDPTMGEMKQAFHESFALQCGFCTPGVLVNVYSLLQEETGPTPPGEEKIRDRLKSNLCRCTGYQGMVAAALHVAGSGDGGPAQ